MNAFIDTETVQHLGIGPVNTGAVQSGYLAAGLFVSIDDLFFRTARRAWRHILARAENEHLQVWACLDKGAKTYLDGVTFAFHIECSAPIDLYLIGTDDKGAADLDNGAERIEINVHEFTNE